MLKMDSLLDAALRRDSRDSVELLLVVVVIVIAQDLANVAKMSVFH